MHSRMQTILMSAAKFSILSLLPKILVIAKDAAVAFYFGVGDALDLYLMAFVLIGLPSSVVVIAFHFTLVPALASKDAESAAALLGAALKLVVSLLLFLLPIWLLLLPNTLNMFYPAAGEGAMPELLQACYWLIPYYFLNGINVLLDGGLQARKVFWPNAVLSAIFPLAIIGSIGLMQQPDIRGLLIGTVIGSLLQSIVLYILLFRRNAIKWRNTADSALRSVFMATLPIMVGTIASSFGPLVEQMFAYNLGPGSVSILNYGNKVPNAINTLLVTAIGVVLLPHFVDMVVANQWRESRALHLRLSGIFFIIGAASACVGIIFADDIIRVLFQRGAFSATDSQNAAEVMQIYLLQLPFLLTAMLSSRALAAMGKTNILAATALLQLFMATGMAFLLTPQHGVEGLAMASVISTSLGMVFMSCVVWYSVTNKFLAQSS
jgi:putative peptidoglycan lipid II flippase